MIMYCRLYVLHKKLCCVNKKIPDIEIMLPSKLM